MKKIVISIVAVFITLTCQAQVPETMHFQGFLTDPVTGDPKPDNNYNLIFSIYNAPSGGTLLWTENHNNVPVSGGLFDVVLGSLDAPLSIAFDVPYHLEVTVDSEVLSPRYELASTAYAFTAKTAETALEVVGIDNIFPATGNAGIGTSSPQQKLQVIGNALITNGRLEVQETTSASEGGEILLAYPAANPTLPTGFVIDAFDDGNGPQLRFFNPTITMMSLEDDGDLNVTGTVSATAFVGNGSGLTGISGVSPWAGSTNISYSAGNVGIGTATPTTLLDISGTGPQLKLRDGAGTWTLHGGLNLLINDGAANIMDISSSGVGITGAVTATSFSGDGSALTNLPATSSIWAGSPDISYTGGKVGIGTASPGTELDINFTNPAASTSIRVENPSTTGFAALSLRNDNRSYALAVGGSTATIGQNSFYILDGASSSARLSIDPTGNVGIGTASPFYKLDILGDVAGGITSRVQNSNTAGFASYRLSNDNRSYSLSIGGSTASTAPNSFYIWDVAAATARFVVDENGHVDIPAGIDATPTPGSGTLEIGGQLRFDDNEINMNDNSNLFVLLDCSNCNVGIGRQPTANKLELNGEASKTVAGNWLANSDSRIKTDISDIQNSLQIIKSLRPVRFRYTDEWMKKNPVIQDRYYYNFIAQEYKKVFPDAVKGSGEYIDGDPNEILQIDTYDAQIFSIKAIQEQQKIIEDQEKRIARLEELVEKLLKNSDQTFSTTASKE